MNFTLWSPRIRVTIPSLLTPSNLKAAHSFMAFPAVFSCCVLPTEVFIRMLSTCPQLANLSLLYSCALPFTSFALASVCIFCYPASFTHFDLLLCPLCLLLLWFMILPSPSFSMPSASKWTPYLKPELIPWLFDSLCKWTFKETKIALIYSKFKHMKNLWCNLLS